MIRPDLRIDAIYRNTNNWKDPKDEFNSMFKSFPDGKGIQNAGGFRYRSRIKGTRGILNASFVILVTNFEEKGWPDKLDIENGIFTYYGDNRLPGKELHDTKIGGNRLLRQVFQDLYENKRPRIPSFLFFENLQNVQGSFMKFLGLAAPGAASASSFDGLVAVWRTYDGRRFQNYRATFTVLKEENIPWAWLDDLVKGEVPIESRSCPPAWSKWVKSGVADPLRCGKSRIPRSKKEQLSAGTEESNVLNNIIHALNDREFEFAAKEILMMLDKRFVNLEVTPQRRDGGRDIIGNYRLGHETYEILMDFCAEAKHWKPTNAVGVKPLSRLISRIRHRDFGVFITTSYYDQQIQQELIDDKHPVLLFPAGISLDCL